MGTQYKNRRSEKGYLTIYVSLTLTVVLSLCLTLIEGARRSTFYLEAECITDIAVSSVFAEYHRELFNQYNLFYIDSAYGSNYPSYYNTEARLKYYLEQNLDLEKVSYLDFLYKDLLELEAGSVYLKKVALATDSGGILFQKQAVKAIEDDVGIGLIENVLDWAETFEAKGLLERDIGREKQIADRQLEAYNGTEKQLTKEEWVTVEIHDPTQHLDNMRAQGVLKWVVDNDTLLSARKVDLNQYISARKRRGEINRGNAVLTKALTVAEQVLFQEYLLRYAGHYRAEKDGSLLQYQAEYLLAGKDEDVENLRYVVGAICGAREVANVLYLYSDAEKALAVEVLANILAAAVLCPETAPLFEVILVIGWAYAESLYDTKLLLAGGKVPLMKDDSSWHYDLDSILESFHMQIHDTNSQGVSYTDYLRVMLYLSDLEQTTFRFMDLVEMDIRLTEGNRAFRMDGCIGSVEAEVVIQSGYGYKSILNKEKQY